MANAKVSSLDKRVEEIMFRVSRSSLEPLIMQQFGERLATHEKRTTLSRPFRGGAKRIRTAGLLVANEALYQLSHNPKSIPIIYHSLAFVNDFFNVFRKNLF